MPVLAKVNIKIALSSDKLNDCLNVVLETNYNDSLNVNYI